MFRWFGLFRMIIAPIFKSQNVNPKIATSIFAKAGDEECQQLTKAYVKLLEELSYIMKNPQLHEFYQMSKIDIAAALEKDGLPGTAKERLRESRRKLEFLLEPLVITDWQSVESGLVEILKAHDFTNDRSAEDFTKEFDFLEQKVPEEERRHINFTKVVVRAIMRNCRAAVEHAWLWHVHCRCRFGTEMSEIVGGFHLSCGIVRTQCFNQLIN